MNTIMNETPWLPMALAITNIVTALAYSVLITVMARSSLRERSEGMEKMLGLGKWLSFPATFSMFFGFYFLLRYFFG